MPNTIHHGPLGFIGATVDVRTDATGGSEFDCPACGKRVRYRNVYPLAFDFKPCRGCRRTWTLVGFGPPDLRRATELVGQTSQLEFHSLAPMIEL